MNEHDIACSIALRLGSCTIDDLRALDLILRDLERGRDGSVSSSVDPRVLPSPDEAHEWDQGAHLTRISAEPARLALDQDREPYLEIDVSKFDVTDADEPVTQMPEYDFEGGGAGG
jgi:hypothetical protein